jgi:hypothetical protein
MLHLYKEMRRVTVVAAILGACLLLLAACGGVSPTLASSSLASSQTHSQSSYHVTVRTSTTTIPNDSEVDLAVPCNHGEVATGGGGAIGSGGIANAYITTTSPYPSTVTKNPTGWHIIAANTSGASQPLTAWVLCAS